MLKMLFLPGSFKFSVLNYAESLHDLNTLYEIRTVPTKYKNMFLSVYMSVTTTSH